MQHSSVFLDFHRNEPKYKPARGIFKHSINTDVLHLGIQHPQRPYIEGVVIYTPGRWYNFQDVRPSGRK